jgi:hypothetical protein
MRRSILGRAAHNPAYKRDEQSAASQDQKDKEDITPCQVTQDVQMVTGLAHGGFPSADTPLEGITDPTDGMREAYPRAIGVEKAFKVRDPAFAPREMSRHTRTSPSGMDD